ncbi:class I SAM-dependent methyltransferase [Candidatus Nitrospira neomarina]|uniref:Class I SAM-dependent methyltransferase n=1 Tax=Candidatus Nitrospira neomarina TaxID=3020899 RepID=A0AA96GNA0_9BACT|nr:class I SAM-dependent methyltransferase [Candidatus Nitrospira neomarina]WNM64007.1 class I SAM-dependent methyltransferase [Candidatus Nitrospira neomarina]
MAIFLKSPSRALKIIRNIIRDLRFGGLFGRTIKTRYANIGAIDTASTEYDVLPNIFEKLIKPTDVLVDVGCGRGRVIRWWISEGYSNQIIGVELDEEVATYAKKQLNKYKNVTIIHGNILDVIPVNGTIFYLYNPFHRDVMKEFKDRMSETFRIKKEVLLVYYNCQHLDLFENDPHWLIQKRETSDIPFSQGECAIIKLVG